MSIRTDENRSAGKAPSGAEMRVLGRAAQAGEVSRRSRAASMFEAVPGPGRARRPSCAAASPAENSAGPLAGKTRRGATGGGFPAAWDLRKFNAADGNGLTANGRSIRPLHLSTALGDGNPTTNGEENGPKSNAKPQRPSGSFMDEKMLCAFLALMVIPIECRPNPQRRLVVRF